LHDENRLHHRLIHRLAVLLSLSLITPTVAASQPSSADVRARETEQRMTNEERLSLIVGLAPTVGGVREKRVPAGVPASAGYIAAVSRLGIPALRETDASLGVTNPGDGRRGDTATALPASLALAATFNPALAREAGAMVGREARAKGFNVLLGGGMDLIRDPRNGRNFEYISEDPLLSAVIASESVIGTQAQSVISTIKHFALNANETNRQTLDAIIDPAADRESDLLAFQMAIERSHPGSIMCAYNKVNDEYACGNEILLDEILKKTWGFKGWVMSDWGAVHDWNFALKGLDQESGAQFDKQFNRREWFGEPLREAFNQGALPHARLSEMVRRILHSIYAVGVDKPSSPPVIDWAKDNATALEVARQGIVLLKNDGTLPLASDIRSIAVIGGRADIGVPTGGGSSTVTPPGGFAAIDSAGCQPTLPDCRKQYFLPSSPLVELKKLLPQVTIGYDAGAVPADAAALARRSDIAIVFTTRYENEGSDSPNLSLPFGQDAMIDAVASANPKTVIVLETGNPVAMPWAGKAKAIIEAWFPGQAGGQAIAEMLTGQTNPSGRLPVTFPADIAQTPRPQLPGFGTAPGTAVTARYKEGAEVGYRWFAKMGEKPLYAFGFGLGYTSFSYKELEVRGGGTITASFTVTNTGAREGADVPQLYLTEAAGDRRVRLLGFERIVLQPGQSQRVTVTADPRLLARFDGHQNRWRIDGGIYHVAIGKSADNVALTAEAGLAQRLFGN
jgi:beta-glucosidase